MPSEISSEPSGPARSGYTFYVAWGIYRGWTVQRRGPTLLLFMGRLVLGFIHASLDSTLEWALGRIDTLTTQLASSALDLEHERGRLAEERIDAFEKRQKLEYDIEMLQEKLRNAEDQASQTIVRIEDEKGFAVAQATADLQAKLDAVEKEKAKLTEEVSDLGDEITDLESEVAKQEQTIERRGDMLEKIYRLVQDMAAKELNE